LLPRFLQSVMGYTATKAGLALTAGGVATLIMMPIVGGVLIKIIQPKYLIAFGLLVEALAAWHLSGFNTEISFAHAAWARVFQGAGLPFLFVPITTISYSGLPPGKSNNASALLNSMRNIGASVGISLGTTILARRSQFHHGRLVESLTPFSHNFRAQAVGSLENLDRVVQQQTAMLSYIDAFWFVALVAAVAIPLAMILRRLKTDHLDLWQVHQILTEAEADSIFIPDGVLDAITQARQQGKIRYCGFTGHLDPQTHLRVLAHKYPFDTVQMPLSVFDSHAAGFQKLVLPELLKQGIAPLAMKTLGGNGQSVKDGLVTPEEALRYTLSLPITTLISGMNSLAQLRQNASAVASFKPYSAEEMAALEKRCSPKHQYETYRHVAYRDGKPNHTRMV